MHLIDACLRTADLLGAVGLSARFAAHDSWSRAQLASHQQSAFVRIVRHAQASSPFYRDLYRGIEMSDDLDSVRLPMTNKRQLMDNFDAVVIDKRLRRVELERHLAQARGDEWLFGRYRVVASAGTSGLRGIFVYDRSAWRVVLANTIRWQRFNGIGPRLPRRVRICSIGADNPMHVTSRIPMSSDVGLFRLMHIEATEPIAAQNAALNAFQPNALMPYPSVAALLAREQIDGRLSIRPSVVATHSELLTAAMARLIEQAWGAEPFNHYGLTEEPHVGTDCAMHAGLHLFEDTVMVEIVDDDYRPVGDGEMGTRWLLTNLYNRTQPLIRYEVTDMLRRAAEPCTCGRPFGLVTTVGGRAEDLLRLPRSEGSGMVLVSPMVISLAVEGCAGVREYTAEHDDGGIRLQLVVPDAADRARIEVELPRQLRIDIERHGAIAPPMAVNFIDAIERNSGRMGKISVVGRRRIPAATKAAQ
jgi:phenylacetate-coenzyme A ligase PaaK-like adenylate-forming protein